MYSASLEKEAFLQMKKLLRGKQEGLTKALDGCNRYLLTLKRECESEFQILPQVGGFELQLQRLSAELDKYLEQPVPEEIREQVMEFYFSVWNFLGICDRLDDNYVIYTDFSEEGHFWLHLYCVRPAENLRQCLDCGTATIFSQQPFCRSIIIRICSLEIWRIMRSMQSLPLILPIAYCW